DPLVAGEAAGEEVGAVGVPVVGGLAEVEDHDSAHAALCGTAALLAQRRWTRCVLEERDRRAWAPMRLRLRLRRNALSCDGRGRPGLHEVVRRVFHAGGRGPSADQGCGNDGEEGATELVRREPANLMLHWRGKLAGPSDGRTPPFGGLPTAYRRPDSALDCKQ